MKANELMIGDWVRRRWTCADTGREIVKDFQVSEIRKNCETLYVWKGGGNMGAVEQIEPIPITPEILEKNGWKNSAPDVWQKEYRGFVFYWEKGTGRIGVDDFRHLQEQWKVHLQIKHIHELQHAIRLCKIEKEIEL